jgi:hypothetical protein
MEGSRDRARGAPIFWELDARQAAILAGILVVTVAIYLPSLRNGWVFDDWHEFVENKLIHSWSFIWNSFRYDSWWFLKPDRLPQSAYYRPLENVWFAANAWLFGTNPVLWHLGKIALHAIVVALCFRVAQLLTGDVATGLLTAALFGLMPAHVGAVVWASAIPEPLSTAFELGAMIFLIQRKPGFSRGLIGALFLCGCAMLTHESAILFPLIVAAYVFIFERVDATATVRIVRAIRIAAPFVVLAIAYMCARLNALGYDFLFGVHHMTDSMMVRGLVQLRVQHPPVDVLMTLPLVLLTYLAVVAIPATAAPTHMVNWIERPEPLLFMTGTAVIVLAAGAFMLGRRSPNRRIYLFCAVWIALTMAPALNLNALWWLVDDRYLYAPSFGWSLALAMVAMEIAASGSRARTVLGPALAVILVAYATSTMQTERYWRDDVAFFSRCVEIGPNEPDYRLRLAAAQNKAGNSEEAARVLERGTQLDPGDVHLHLKLAQQYQMMGRQADFMREFQKVTELSAAKALRNDTTGGAYTSQPAGGTP